MSVTFNFGTGSQATAVSKSMKPWNYSAAFRIQSDNGSVARMTDILTPLDKKTTIKVSLDRIANVYSTLADNAVPVAEQSANVSGQTVFVELKTIATRVDGNVTIQVPMVSRLELRLPNDANIAESDVEALVMATYAALCDNTGNCIVTSEKMRGALTPVGL